MSWASGFVQGLAGSIDKALQDDMRRTQDFIEKQTDIQSRRRMVAEERRRKEMEEIEDDLGRLSSLWAGDPNALDKAASAYQALGGNSKAVDSIYDTVMKAKLSDKDFSVDSVFDISYENTKGYGMADYIETFVSAPQTFDVNLPDTYKSGIYTTLFKPDIAGQIQAGAEAAAPAMEQTGRALSEGELTPAQIRYGVLPQVSEAEMQREAAGINLERQRLQLQQDLFNAGNMEEEYELQRRLNEARIKQLTREADEEGMIPANSILREYENTRNSGYELAELGTPGTAGFRVSKDKLDEARKVETQSFNSIMSTVNSASGNIKDTDVLAATLQSRLKQVDPLGGNNMIQYDLKIVDEGGKEALQLNGLPVVSARPVERMIPGQPYVKYNEDSNTYTVQYRIGDRIIESNIYSMGQ